jgi:hypothetical protein
MDVERRCDAIKCAEDWAGVAELDVVVAGTTKKNPYFSPPSAVGNTALFQPHMPLEDAGA